MGNIIQASMQCLPPKPQWDTKQIPDMSGKVVIVTGANTGIGKDTAKALLEHNAKVYLACRNQGKAEAAIADLKTSTGKEALLLECDLGNLKSIKSAAESFLSKEKELHVLFNSGGVMAPPKDQLTAQGYDLQFGTNVLGHFYLTKLLLSALNAAAENSPEKQARVITTSSVVHWIGKLNFNAFKDGPARRKIDPWFLYAQSKFGNIVFAKELSRRYTDEGIISVALHPGNLNSELLRHHNVIGAVLRALFLYPAEMGALTQLRAGTTPEGAEWNGKYGTAWARLGACHKGTDDPALGKELWEWCEEQVKDI